jgi:hypothetical protein
MRLQYDGHPGLVVQAVPPSQHPLRRHASNLRAATLTPFAYISSGPQKRLPANPKQSGPTPALALPFKQGWRLLIPNRSCNFRPTPVACPRGWVPLYHCPGQPSRVPHFSSSRLFTKRTGAEYNGTLAFPELPCLAPYIVRPTLSGRSTDLASAGDGPVVDLNGVAALELTRSNRPTSDRRPLGRSQPISWPDCGRMFIFRHTTLVS